MTTISSSLAPFDHPPITGRRFFLLFLFLLATLVLYPYAETSHIGYLTLRLLGSIAILLAVYAVSSRRTILILAIVLAIPALLQRFLFPRNLPSNFSILGVVLSFVFDVFIVVVIFRRVFARTQANAETIFGALCIYLLVGFSFASIYQLMAVFQPVSFYLDPQTNLHAVPDRFDFIYYSFCTMTSLGATGITAVTAQSRSVTILEAILGVLYLAVLVARLIGAYRGQARSTDLL